VIQKTMIAKFRTVCPCGNTIQVGRQMGCVDGEWLHMGCAREAVKIANVCGSCHMTRPCECE